MCESQCGKARSPCRGAEASAFVAGKTSGIVPTVASAGAIGQHDHGGAEHLLGAGPADRRVGGGAGVRGSDRGVVRPTKGGTAAAFAGPAQASDRLSARDRLAGSQAGGVCRVSLSGGVVSDKPISHGLRRIGGDGVGTSGPRIPGNSAPGGASKRSGSGRGVASLAGDGRRQFGRRRGAVAGGDESGAGAGGECRTHQPIAIR
jgi:hypothetical protein